MRNYMKFVEVLEKLFDEAMSKRNGGIIVTRFGGQEELRNTLIGKDGFQSFEKYFAWIYGILTDRYYALMEQYIYLTEEEIENIVLDEVKSWYVEET